MIIIVNGEAREITPGLTLSALLVEMQLTGRRIAVERNGEIVPKSSYAGTPVTPGDQIEIVVAVGGG